MSDLNQLQLQPQRLWHHFQSLCNIPHPSFHEAQIAEHVMAFARQHGLDCEQDTTGNVIIRKPATAGYEQAPGVILQAHLDMVPEKNSDTVHDFTQDPIQTCIDGEWMTARGTTLGADNGIGVAAALAVLESKEIVHGPLEALFTMTEESGMVGARGLQPDALRGDILLNLDTEEDGQLYIGCAGGARAYAKADYEQEAAPAGMAWRKVNLTGLCGGHSGCDIHLGRGNAIRLMVRLLRRLEALGARISTLKGGGLVNAIPREAEAIIAIPEQTIVHCEALVDEYATLYRQELQMREPGLKLTIAETKAGSQVIPQNIQQQWLAALHACPGGVQRMSDALPGVVETSCNLGVLTIAEGTINVQMMPRSLVDSARDDMLDIIQGQFSLIGAECWHQNSYPGWQPNPESPALALMQSTYRKLFDKEPVIKVVHAGLECGLLSGIYPHWDMISFGPTIKFPHSPDEKVHIPSVGKFWELLQAGLKAFAEQR